MGPFRVVGSMGGNNCWAKPILETRVFAKGRGSFCAEVVGTRWSSRLQCTDGPAGVSREQTLGAWACARDAGGAVAWWAGTGLAGFCHYTQNCPNFDGVQVGTWGLPLRR